MEISVINQSEEKQWSRFRKDFSIIAKRTEEILKLEKEYSESVRIISCGNYGGWFFGWLWF